MSILSKLVPIINIYGLSFPLRYKQKSKFTTNIGFILTILTLASIITVILIFLIQIFTYNDFSIIQNSEQTYGKKLLDLTKVPILIGFMNNLGHPIKIDPSFINITLEKNEYYPELNQEKKMILRKESKLIKLENCDLNIHFNNNSNVINMIKYYEYNNYLCPVPGQNLSIGGRFGDSIFGYDMLKINLIKCVNNSEINYCKSKEEMEFFFNNSYMSIIYLSETVNHYDVKNPIKRNFRSEVFFIVSNAIKRYYYYFSPGIYKSDKGFLFKNEEIYNFFEYENTIIEFVEQEENNYYSNKNLIEITFTCMDKFIHYQRNYQKIQNSFGNIGGWIRIILIVCQFFSDYFSEKIFLLDIVNTIFPPLENDKKIKRSLTHKFFKDFKNHVENKNYSEYNKSDNNDNENNLIHLINNNNNTNNILHNIFNNISNINKNVKSKNKIKNLFDSNSIKTQNYVNTNNNLMNYKLKKDQSNYELNNTSINLEEKLKKFYFRCFDYFLPFFILRKGKRYKAITFYKKFIYTDISIDVLIPLVERITSYHYGKDDFKKNEKKFFSKMNESVIINTLTNKENIIMKT